jgi:hypothetical protein
MSKSKIKLEIAVTGNGVTIWATKGKDRRWIIDASTILLEGTFSFDSKRFKQLMRSPNYNLFKLTK